MFKYLIVSLIAISVFADDSSDSSDTSNDEEGKTFCEIYNDLTLREGAMNCFDELVSDKVKNEVKQCDEELKGNALGIFCDEMHPKTKEATECLNKYESSEDEDEFVVPFMVCLGAIAVVKDLLEEAEGSSDLENILK